MIGRAERIGFAVMEYVTSIQTKFEAGNLRKAPSIAHTLSASDHLGVAVVFYSYKLSKKTVPASHAHLATMQGTIITLLPTNTVVPPHPIRRNIVYFPLNTIHYGNFVDNQTDSVTLSKKARTTQMH